MAQPNFEGQTYGQATQQRRAVQAVPTAAPPTDIQRPTPGRVASMNAPTARPNEPITAGAPFGAGPTPQQAGIMPEMEPQMGSRQYLIERVRALYTTHPNPNLYALMVALESD